MGPPLSGLCYLRDAPNKGKSMGLTKQYEILKQNIEHLCRENPEEELHARENEIDPAMDRGAAEGVVHLAGDYHARYRVWDHDIA